MTRKTRVAFVVSRYGTEVSGGAETHCRLNVEHLAPEYDIEIITTCAQDYMTWDNVYAPGLDDVNGIPVIRFPNIASRAADFSKRTDWIVSHPHTLRDESDWFNAQGPHSPALIEYILQRRDDFDAFVFVGYLYYPTVYGLRLLPEKSLLMPTAHDEAYIYFKWFQAMFSAPRGFIYNTPEEKHLIEDIFGVDHIPNAIVGVGIDVPLNVDGARFHQQAGIDTPYVYYGGRLSHSKNCQELLDFFIGYKDARPDVPLNLVLTGTAEFPVPERDDILSLGFLTDAQKKDDVMAGALAFILPSKLESLSLVTLESMALGTPVLCNGTSDVLRGHCLRSNAGLFYDTFDEFAASLDILRKTPRLRALMGENGRQYVAQNYTWQLVIEKYRRMIDMVVAEPWW